MLKYCKPIIKTMTPLNDRIIDLNEEYEYDYMTRMNVNITIWQEWMSICLYDMNEC